MSQGEAGLLVRINTLFVSTHSRTVADLLCYTDLSTGTTDAIFHEKPQLYDLIIDLAPPTSTPSASPYAPPPSPSSSSPPPTSKAARPISYVSRPVAPPAPASDTASAYSSNLSNSYKLSAVRFTWSDVRLVSTKFHFPLEFAAYEMLIKCPQWQELDRLLALDSSYPHSHPHPHPQMPDCGDSSGWSDAWKLYEDVCLVCAGLWMGMGAWKDSPLHIELEGDDEINVNLGANTAAQDESYEEVEGGGDAGGVAGPVVRELGNGIEGRPVQASGSGIMPGSLPEGPSVLGIGMVKVGKGSKGMRRTSGMSIFGRDKDRERRAGVASGSAGSSGCEGPTMAKTDGQEMGRDQDREILTTLALLQTFHANTAFLLSKLATFVPPGSRVASPSASLGRRASKRGRHASGDDGRLPGSDGRKKDRGTKKENTIVLTPKDMSSFELGPLSGLDAKFVEWLGEEYAADGTQVVVKKGWKEVLGFVFGF